MSTLNVAIPAYALNPYSSGPQLVRDGAGQYHLRGRPTPLRDEDVLLAAQGILLDRCRHRDAMSEPTVVARFLQARLGTLDIEHFVALWLDTQHRLVEVETLAIGTLDAAAVYPREVVKAALHRCAQAVIFAHNHPSGVAEPSGADRLLTERLKHALAVIDVRVLDHFVVAGSDSVSFATRGWL